MSGLAVAVANALLSELGICDLPSFTSMVRHDTAGVLAALESDACRAAADAAAVEPAAASMAADAAMAVQEQLMRDELRSNRRAGSSGAVPSCHTSNDSAICSGSELAASIGAAVLACSGGSRQEGSCLREEGGSCSKGRGSRGARSSSSRAARSRAADADSQGHVGRCDPEAPSCT